MAPGGRWDVGVLGATGLVGQQIVRRLEGHPWFRTCWLGASERSAGARYGELPWLLSEARPKSVDGLLVERATPGQAPRLLFSALDASAAGEIETAFAKAGHIVVSNARSHRLAPDVPLLVPEVNPSHLALLEAQRRKRRWQGAIVTNPNCSTAFLVMVLAACREFRPRRVVVTTLQAISGAGYPGLPSWDVMGNVIPFIDGEEEKIQVETAKILGTLDGDTVDDDPIAVSAQATRVPVADGHTEAISIEFDRPPSQAALVEALARFSGRPQQAGLPSAPRSPIEIVSGRDRPQPRLDLARGDGMTVSVGRVRPCPVLHYRLVALGHNTVRGAAGAALLNMELLAADGWLEHPAGAGVRDRQPAVAGRHVTGPGGEA
ncbi:MAG TPA: aspartate-semialdehyde dehydrogenase [Vicinamibacterales bacterium]|nr:aspartate-semialdehyde dehydrogenase [Acidobacteriota bacterium]HOC19554.1 aspartate-semialdehyde dehydrogenase [Vicinamibacterales bacterium]